MKYRFRISVVLMVLSMALLAAFQAWWLRKSYREEKETLDIRTSIIFRESIYGLQASKLSLDSNFQVALPSKTNAIGVINVLRDSLRIRSTHEKSSMFVSVDRPIRRDTTISKTMVRLGPDKIFEVLLASENPGDSIKLTDIDSVFGKALKKQNIDIPYNIVVTNLKVLEGLPRQPLVTPGRDVTIGFMHPLNYKLELGNTFPYLLTQITPQLLFTLFLLTVTFLSFVMLLRSLMAQRKLSVIKNEFISNITHELKTPIATVSVAIEALKNFNALHDPQKTKEYLDISQNELQRLSLLVDKVLKLSMFENQAIELKPELIDLKDIVEDVTSSMKLQLEKYGATLNIDASGSSMLRGDKLHLTSVVFNLLDNALKYSKGIPAIRIEIKEEPQTIELAVTDNGIGIEPEYQHRIFEKFFRVPAGDTHNAKGYGLGLSYVAHVVQKHNGAINVESQPGIGSRFIVKLPKANEQNEGTVR